MRSLVMLFLEIAFTAFEVIRALYKRLVCCFIGKHYKKINNDVVLITGGGSGIGRLLALEFAKHQPKHIVLWGRHEDTLSATAGAVKLHHIPCTYMICDVRKKEDVFTNAKDIENTVGAVTILVNNAGVVFSNTVLESNIDDIDQTFKVNTLAQMWTVKSILPAMVSANHGHIVSINSILGLLAMNGVADYCASKAAASIYLETLSYELHRAEKDGIHLTTVYPGIINTDMFAGCNYRFSSIFRPLDKNYVAWKTVDAVLTNQSFVYMPRFMYLVFLIRSIFPMSAIMPLHKFFGLDAVMDTFHGRKKK